MTERISFEEAITDPKLLAKHFATLSKPQQTVLKAFNGLELTEEELVYWAILQGSCTVDELGYVTKVTPVPYKAKKYDKLIAILGRRSGKTDRITATQLAYEATLGGHMQYVEKGQDVQILFVAQDIDMAASHLNFVHNALRSSPLLYRTVSKFNSDAIVFTSGLKIVPAPPTIKSSRGLAVPGWCADETGFWYTDTKAANPDYEVERAVEYATAQFPDSFQIVTSTPYTKEGMLWDYHNAGTEGIKLPVADRAEHEGVLVVHASTAAMQNPRITRKKLARLQKSDPEAFVRESLAQFVDSISGFLQPELVKLAQLPLDDESGKVFERAKQPRIGFPNDPAPYYVAAMDPAFRHDNFAFAVFHHDMKYGIVQDIFREWVPEKGIPLNPTLVLDEIKGLLEMFGLATVYSDQYQLESLQQLALGKGFSIYGVDFTASSKAKIYGSFRSLINQKRLRLLSQDSIYEQLTALEKKLNPNGSVSINAPAGKKDDAAAAIALGVSGCIWMLPDLPIAPPKPQTHVEEGYAQIMRHRREAEGEFDSPNEDEWDEAV